MNKEQFNLRFSRMVTVMKKTASFGLNMTTHETQEEKDQRTVAYCLQRATKRADEKHEWKLRQAGLLKRVMAVLPELVAKAVFGNYRILGKKIKIVKGEGSQIIAQNDKGEKFAMVAGQLQSIK